MSARQTVLLIEDNPGDADLVRLRLVESESDVEVRCVDRLSAGLDHLGDEQPSLVLLDLNLPDSHGAETFRSNCVYMATMRSGSCKSCDAT